MPPLDVCCISCPTSLLVSTLVSMLNTAARVIKHTIALLKNALTVSQPKVFVMAYNALHHCSLCSSATHLLLTNLQSCWPDFKTCSTSEPLHWLVVPLPITSCSWTSHGSFPLFSWPSNAHKGVKHKLMMKPAKHPILNSRTHYSLHPLYFSPLLIIAPDSLYFICLDVHCLRESMRK
jgi:hypothetical protein